MRKFLLFMCGVLILAGCTSKIFTAQEFVEGGFKVGGRLQINVNAQIICFNKICGIGPWNRLIRMNLNDSKNFFPYAGKTVVTMIEAEPDCTDTATKCNQIKNVSLLSGISVEKSASTDDWEVYKNGTMGITLKYPKLDQYAVGEFRTEDYKNGDKTIKVEEVLIAQPDGGNRFFLSRSKDKGIMDLSAQIGVKEKTIGDLTYKEFHYDGMGEGYGYVIEKNGWRYVFSTVWGPTNEDFDLMMTTVQFQ